MGIQLIAAALAAASAPVHLSATSALPAPVPVDARPAIWVVNDADTTIFLFGTFHALDGRSPWFNDEIRTAFARSDELVLESVVMPGDRAAAAAPSASFLASARLAIAAGRARGLKPANGADVVLRAEAEADGKRISGLESAAGQRAMLDRMPAPSRAAALPASPATVSTLAALIGQMQAAWNRGDQGIFAAMIDQMRQTSPAGYATLFTDRNRDWAGWIARRLDQPGTVFVAVGAGHLVGRDSVQAKLSALGVRSARIN